MRWRRTRAGGCSQWVVMGCQCLRRARRGDDAVLGALLAYAGDHGVVYEWVRAGDTNGVTAVHCAAGNGHVGVLIVMLGAAPMAVNEATTGCRGRCTGRRRLGMRCACECYWVRRAWR